VGTVTDLRYTGSMGGTNKAPHRGSGELDLRRARTRLGLTQTQMATVFNIPSQTIQNWESGIGTSEMPQSTADLRELLELMDEYVIPRNEKKWLNTPSAALGNQKPIQAILEGKMRNLILEFLRLADGQAV
jgi:transcriptional regulator with XRE-family HTH domain